MKKSFVVMKNCRIIHPAYVVTTDEAVGESIDWQMVFRVWIVHYAYLHQPLKQSKNSVMKKKH